MDQALEVPPCLVYVVKRLWVFPHPPIEATQFWMASKCIHTVQSNGKNGYIWARITHVHTARQAELGQKGHCQHIAHLFSHLNRKQNRDRNTLFITYVLESPRILEPSAVPALCLELKLRNLPGRSLWLHWSAAARQLCVLPTADCRLQAPELSTVESLLSDT